MPIIPEGFAQLNFVFGGEGCPQGAEVTLGVQPELGSTPAELAAFARDSFVPSIMPEVNDDVTLVEVRCKFGPNDDGPSATASSGAPGASGGIESSPQVSYLVKKVTALGGRKHRGRLYLPGVGNDFMDSPGVISGARAALVTGAFEDMRDTFDLAGNPLYLLHSDEVDPDTGESIPGTAADPTPITSFVCETLLATQRRRLRG